MRILRTGKVFVTPPKLRLTLRNAGVGDDLVFEITNALQSLYPDVAIDPELNVVVSPPMPAERLADKTAEVLQVYSDTADRVAAMQAGDGGDLDGDDEEDDFQQ